MSPLLSIKNLQVNLDNSRVLFKDLNFEANKNEIISIIGQSGSGKSTLLEIIAGLRNSSSGDVRTNGSLSYLPQNVFLQPWRTTLQSALLPIELQNKLNENNISDAKKLLTTFDLEKELDTLSKNLSGGMRQRVAIVQSIMQNSDILLLDEPFNGIDFELQVDIISFLRKHFKLNNKLVLLITHSLEEAISISDRLLIFSTNKENHFLDIKIDFDENIRNLIDITSASKFNEIKNTIWDNISRQTKADNAKN